MLWTTPQFGLSAFGRLLDRLLDHAADATPTQPDSCAADGAGVGALLGLLTVMKGQPLAYSKDMQEDKEGAFDALATLSLCLAAMTGMVEDLTPDADRMKAAAGAGYATATDLADWLVRELKVPFREAHHIVGKIVALASGRGAPLEALTLADLQGVEPRITKDALGVLGVERSVRAGHPTAARPRRT